MKPIFTILVFVCLALSATAQPSSGNVIAIKAGTLIDGKSDAPAHDKVILVRGNRIESISDANTKIPPGATVIDLSHATVLPGLIDSHTHIFLQGEDPAAGWLRREHPQISAGLARRTSHGLRTPSARAGLHHLARCRDRGRRLRGCRNQRGDRRRLSFPGRACYVVTRAISTTGGYSLDGYAPELQMPKGAQIADGPVEMRKATREQLDHGADWIKVYMTHRSWVGKNGELVSQPTLTLEEIKAVVDEAHGWGKKVACHAYSGIGLQRALDGGCDSIEHGLQMTDAQIAQMVKQGTWYCPTLSVYYTDWAPADSDEGKRDRLRASAHEVSFRKALKAGVKIVFGTDMGGIPWTEPIAQEFPRMVEFGMTPMDAIKSATSRAADMLEAQGQIGVLATGAYADVVAVPGDPLADIKQLGNVQFVMKDGKVYKSDGKFVY